MKKFLLGTVGLVALGMASAPASAADLAARPVYTKAAPMVAAIYDWSGFYIGGNGGWGSSHNCWDATTAAGTLIAAARAAMTRREPPLVVRWAIAGSPARPCSASKRKATGLTSVARNASLATAGLSTNRTKLDAFGLFTGQIGYAWNNALLYVKGGAAVTDNKNSILATGTNALIASTGDYTRWGGTVGVGLEYGFAPNWSFGVEYDHLFMQDKNVGFTTPAGVAFGFDNTRQDVDMVTARVNYRWGGPVIGKY